MRYLLKALLIFYSCLQIAFGQESDKIASPAKPYFANTVIIWSEYLNEPPQPPPPALKIPKQKLLGSGVLVSPDGYILTARHVVEAIDPELQRLLVQIRTRESQSYVARVEKCADSSGVLVDRVHQVDNRVDLCIIKIDNEASVDRSVQSFPCIAAQKLQIYDNIWLVGWPGDETFKLDAPAPGTVSSSSLYPGDRYQIDKAEYPGTSGGPAFNNKGNIVGLIQGGVTGTRTLITSFEKQRAFLEGYGSQKCGGPSIGGVTVSVDVQISNRTEANSASSRYASAADSDFQLHYEYSVGDERVASLPAGTGPFLFNFTPPRLPITISLWAVTTRAGDYLADPIEGLRVTEVGTTVDAGQMRIAERPLYIAERFNRANRVQDTLKGILADVDPKCFGDTPAPGRAACRENNSKLLLENKSMIRSIIADRERAARASLVVADRGAIVGAAANFSYYIGQPCSAWQSLSNYFSDPSFSKSGALPQTKLVGEVAIYLASCADDSPSPDLPKLIGAFADLLEGHDALFFNASSPRIVANYLSLFGRLGGRNRVSSIIPSQIAADPELTRAWQTLIVFSQRNCGLRTQGSTISEQYSAMVKLDEKNRCASFNATHLKSH